MNILALDGSTSSLEILLMKDLHLADWDKRIIKFRSVPLGYWENQHTIALHVDEMLEALHLNRQDLSGICIGVGPGNRGNKGVDLVIKFAKRWQKVYEETLFYPVCSLNWFLDPACFSLGKSLWLIQAAATNQYYCRYVSTRGSIPDTGSCRMNLTAEEVLAKVKEGGFHYVMGTGIDHIEWPEGVHKHYHDKKRWPGNLMSYLMLSKIGRAPGELKNLQAVCFPDRCKSLSGHYP